MQLFHLHYLWSTNDLHWLISFIMIVVDVLAGAKQASGYQQPVSKVTHVSYYAIHAYKHLVDH